MTERKKITLELSKEEEVQFLHDFLGNIVIGNPFATSRRHSDSVIYKLGDKGIRYEEEEDRFYLKVKELMYIEFIA